MKTPVLLLSLLPLAAGAQAPTLTATTPARNAVAAPRLSPVTLTFSGPVTGAADLRVHGSQWRGRRSGTSSGDGTNTLVFRPQQVFAPGEKVSVTVPASVRGSGAGGQPLTRGQVIQFVAASGPATGSYGTEQRFYTAQSSGVYAPTLADVNNDGNLDLLFTNAQTPPLGVLLRLGNGQGGFGALTTAVGPFEARKLVMADFNHDGNLDLVAAGYQGAYGLSVALGNGQGSFTPRPFIPNGGLTTAPQVGDLNADGHLDVVAVAFASQISPTPDNTLLVHLGDGLGNFTAQPGMTLPWNGGLADISLNLVDLNNDGQLDFPYFNPVAGRVETYLGNGAGGFTLATPAPAPTTTIVGVAELTGDGIPDLVCAGPANTLVLHAGNGQGGFTTTATASFPADGRQGFHTADVDADGDLDVLIGQWIVPAGGCFQKIVRLWHNNGTGTFTAGPTLSQPSGEITTGDVNNDGTLDMAVIDLHGDSFGPYIGVRLNAPLAMAPTLSSFTPATAPAGTAVTITGSNFTGATAVLIGGVPVTGFTVVNGTTITFTVPAGSPTGLVTVLTPTGQATSPAPLRNGLATRARASALPVQLFPNPAQSVVQLQLAAGTKAVQVAFYNGLGQCVRQASPALLNGTAALDLNGLAPGLYSLRLQAAQQTAVLQLVVK
ncbi:hypothetical protein GCM10023185_24520 [Hymenobacter saemangeumensis]|uniref:T9SS type A sorting domain-containing protein n=1 Tax=Hymenobacter saemangeumensis TaxID=1084522 RepID=A0ABP8IH02_9BACT